MKFIISFFFLLLAFISTLCGDPNKLTINNTNINCYRSYEILPRERPSSELVLSLEDENRYGNTPLARHHIIPYATLRDFYNRLITDRPNFQRLYQEVISVAATNAGLLLFPYNSLHLYVTQRLEGLSTTLFNHLSNEIEVSTTQEVYTWLPFNIFIGPTPDLRSDDTRSNSFEENAYVIVGRERINRLRELNIAMAQFVTGDDPTNIINTMAELVRSTPVPYSFRLDQWRVHITRNRYAIATPEIINDSSYRELQATDYCNESGEHRFDGDTPEFTVVRRQSRQRRSIHKSCLLRDDDGAKYDRYCINSLNILRELVKHKVLAINGNELDIVHTTPPHQCNTELTVVGGAIAGGLTALGACLLAGGAYIPVLGWVGCAIGSSIYGIAGAAVGAGASAICNA